MGDISEQHWLASRCKPDASKGGIYKVYLSIPPELRNHYGKNELKKSTGTRDPVLARRLQHEITSKWYREFRTILGTDNYAKLIKLLALETTEYHFRFIDHQPFGITFSTRPQSLDEANEAVKIIGLKIKELEIAVMDNDAAYLLNSGILKSIIGNIDGIKVDEIKELYQLVKFELEDEFSISATASAERRVKEVITAPNTSLFPKISEFILPYFQNRKWDNNTSKEKKTSRSRIHHCLKIIGDPPVDQLLPRHGHLIAETLEADGLANSTIKGYITSLSGLIDYIRFFEMDETVRPFQPWITSNPLSGLPLANYGKSKRSFEALTHSQLFQLFNQNMPSDDRLCLELLIATGCRLDEIALLTWEQIKVDKTGIRYIDLASGAVVKNDNSKRLVPIPDVVKLPQRSSGRLFSYKIDTNGKASRAAGKHLLANYIHPVRTSTSDDRKTVHSLRHNFIGFLDNLSPPISENLKDWITGHKKHGGLNESERRKTYGSDPDLSLKYEAVNRVQHPWLTDCIQTNTEITE